MTEGDELLGWLSYRKGGSRKDLPSSLLQQRQPTLVLWRLAVLAHIELQPLGRWAIVPPTLAGIGGEDGPTNSAILCGARTPHLIQKLRSVSQACGAYLEEVALDHEPSRITVSAKRTTDLEAFADAAGLAYQVDAAFALLAALPRIAEWPREPIPAVAGRVGKVTRFSSRSGLRWIDSSLGEATDSVRGLFHIRRDWDAVTVLKAGRDGHFAIETAAGRIAVVRGQKLARFDERAKTFELPTALTPPVFVARALSLSSGRMPTRNRSTGLTQFASVPTRTARLALALMELRLQ